MPDFKDPEKLQDMRRRLYERGTESTPVVRHELSATPHVAPAAWSDQPEILTLQTPVIDPRTGVLTEPTVDVIPPKKRRLSYRAIILLVSAALFLLVLGLSSLYLMFGNTLISSNNIGISIAGPLTIGGGEEMKLQVGVTNQNKVPIESAVLIVSYPVGTKSVGEDSKEIFEERVTLNRISAGEAVNVPVSAIIFGEENQEQQIRATIEYRLVDSNGTFFKEADPLTFKINSSPVVIRVDTVKKVSAGQEIDVKLTIQSNSPNPLKNLLVSASYPSNFEYTTASPEPMYRESEWLIDEILPEKSTTITIKGVVVGNQSEEFQLQFSIGTPQKDNQFMIGSVLANATADFLIEQPFINVGMEIDGKTSDVVTLATGKSTAVTVIVQNTLTETLYDMVVEVEVKGNILVRELVEVEDGYYDSVKDVIRYEPSGNQNLVQIDPGATKEFTFTLKPSDKTETPSFSLTANAYARRVFENRATEQLVGTVKREVKFTSSVGITRKLARGVPGFIDGGTVPPVADAETTYTVTLQASAGGNDVTGAVVTTSLPQYVSWKNLALGDGSIVFNPISKEVTWTIGGIDAASNKNVSFQVGLLPSQNQIGVTPAVVGAQRFRATDRFTGAVVRAEGVPLSSELGIESGFEEQNGRVQKTPLP